LNFQVKMQGFMPFYCKNLYLWWWPETGTRGLNRPPWGLKMSNAWGFQNLAGGSTPPTPFNLHPKSY